ncbi:MAG: hypothetical protein CBE46_000200 [Candidatus Pelagibacter sp. TMED286]|nr:MAG: hypothetical protein CNB20_00230 [Pelagibacterales bacterium MED-G43]RPG95831.1 MAG: hypothetical protein CBE46_000200 [Candidatus Pelagibacter sp. TMED286]|tara:strand:+ start:292 stop:801 length:510 start_codon:yes stop_codon:yes gene_type:complete
MQENQENKIELKDKLENLYSYHKGKIYIFIIVLLIAVTSFALINNLNKKKSIKIGQQYIEAGIYLASDNKNQAKKIYEEIILSKNNFYSILALNKIVEKKLVIDKNKILKYFNILEKSISSKDERELIIFKKALYLIKNSDAKTGEDLMKNLIEQDSSLKNIIQEILIK